MPPILRPCLLALGLLLPALPVLAAPGAKLPSRRPEVVLPLLRQFTSREGLDRIAAILGKPDADLGEGMSLYHYRLTDDSSIVVAAAPGKVFYILRTRHGAGRQLIYTVTNAAGTAPAGP